MKSPEIIKAELECLETLKKCQESDDTEQKHLEADEALCQFLISLGYQNIVDEYEKFGKWYA